MKTQTRKQPQADRTMYQEVRLTLDDGRVLKFAGPAQVTEAEHRGLKVVDVEFSQPMPLPTSMTWDTVAADRTPVANDDYGLDSDA